MNIDKLAHIVSRTVVAGSAALALSGCSVDAASTPSPEAPPEVAEQAGEENTGDVAEALKAGGGGGSGMSFSCGALGCICHGDYDCNNMFDGGACGAWPAKCYERGPGPVYCICAPWVGKASAVNTGSVAAPGAGVLAP